jgi:putative peptidoglycan lipid II flippase
VFKKLIDGGVKVLSAKQTNVFSAAFFIFAAFLLSAFLGLIRTRILASYFGATRDLDIYFAAFRIPDILYQLLVMGALSSAFIPVFTKLLIQDDKEANVFASICMNLSIVVFLIFNIFVFFFSEPLCKILTPGFSAKDITVMAALTRIMVSAQIFFIVGNYLTGILQSLNHFLFPALASTFYNIGIILGTLLLAPKFGIYGPTFGVLLGTLLFFLIQIPMAIKMGFRYNFSFDYKNTHFVKMFKIMIPRTLSIGVTQIELSSDLFVSSFLIAGRYTIFNYGIILMSLPIRLFAASIGQASLPTLSALFSQDKKEEFSAILKTSVRQIFFFVIPMTVLIVVLRIPFVRIAFGAKIFTWDATVLTGRTLAALSLGILGQSATQILLRAYYAAKDTKTPLFLSLIAVFFNVFFSLLFVFILKLDVVGLGLSTSISSFLLAVLLYYTLVKNKILIKSHEIYREVTKVLIAGIIMAVLTYVPMKILDQLVFDTTRTLSLVMLTGIVSLWGGLVYLLVAWVLKIEELQIFFAFLTKLGSWRKNLKTSEEIVSS